MRGVRGRSENGSDVEVLDFLGVVLDELAAGLDLLAHEGREDRVGLWHLHGLESANYWDYLVDPVFAVTAVLMSLWSVVRRCSVAEPVACGGRE